MAQCITFTHTTTHKVIVPDSISTESYGQFRTDLFDQYHIHSLDKLIAECYDNSYGECRIESVRHESDDGLRETFKLTDEIP